MSRTIQFRRGTAAQWAAANPVLAPGEPGYETDTDTHKIGDGATAWVDLPAASGTGPGGDLTSGPVRSSGGESSIAPNALSLAMTSGLQSALNTKANLSGAAFTGAISATNLSGTNTGDQNLSGYAQKATANTFLEEQEFRGGFFVPVDEFNTAGMGYGGTLSCRAFGVEGDAEITGTLWVQGATKYGQGVFLTTSTALTLTDAHNGRVIICTATSPITITVNGGLEPYFHCQIIQKAAGAVTIGGTAIMQVFGGGAATTGGLHAQMSIANLGTPETYHVGGQTV